MCDCTTRAKSDIYDSLLHVNLLCAQYRCSLFSDELLMNLIIVCIETNDSKILRGRVD